MAKSIKLTPDPVTPAPATAPLSTMPPPASLPPGVTGTPPLPVGRPVRIKYPTPGERDALAKAGWVEGQPVPESMTAAVQAAAGDMRSSVTAAEQVIPVAPDTPPVAFNVVDEAALPREQQAAVRAKIAGMVRPAAAAPRAAQASQPVPRLAGPLPGVAQKVAAGRKIDVADMPPPERPGTRIEPDPDYIPPAAATDFVPADAGTDAVKTPASCPHCHWNLAMTDTADPTSDEKLTFLQAFMGQIPYVQEYPLFGGKMIVTFRTLTGPEIDAIYQQVYRERERKDISGAGDAFERINRYRLFLQLQRLRGEEFDHELPDGLSKRVNPNAREFYEFDADTKEPLLLIERYIMATVLPSESLLRITQQLCARFNRLVARLEALADNASFWTATGQQSGL